MISKLSKNYLFCNFAFNTSVLNNRLQPNSTSTNELVNYDAEIDDDEDESAFHRPINWFGWLILYPRRKIVDLKNKVLKSGF